MASSPVNPSSPTGTLKRDASKKDSGKLGWVGTLTRRKKGQEGRFLWLRTKTFYLEIWIIQRAIKGSSVWQLKFEVTHFLFYASLCHLFYITRLNEESAVIFIGLVPSNFNNHFWNTLAVFDRWIMHSIFVNSIANSSILTHPFLLLSTLSIIKFFDRRRYFRWWSISTSLISTQMGCSQFDGITFCRCTLSSGNLLCLF